MQKVREALQNRIAIAVVAAGLSVVGTWLATAYPDVYWAMCKGGV